MPAKYHFIADRQEWVGIIYTIENGVTVVDNVGCENTETEIIAWCQSGGKLPDMYDRATKQ